MPRPLIPASRIPVETVQLCPPDIRATLARTRAALEQARPLAEGTLDQSAEAAEVVGALTENAELANALLLRPVLGQDGLTPEQLGSLTSAGAIRIASDLQRIGDVGLPRDWSPAQGLNARQAETVRKMLLAVVSD